MTDQCKNIESQIQNLVQQVSFLQSELSKPGASKRSLIAQIMNTQAEINKKNEELAECMAIPHPPLSNPKIFGFEVTQGIPEYELVAGKDTLVRVFVGVKPQVLAPIMANKLDGNESALIQDFKADLFAFGSSRLDFASLQVTRPNGSSFEVYAEMSGRFTNHTKSLSEDDNVNFYISGNFLDRVESYSFVARFYRDGVLVGTNNLGTHEFNDTKDLRLLIVVDTWPMPTEAWSTLSRTLEFFHRNMPLRSGISALDSDLTSGLRYYIDPVPFDPDWQAWGPVEEYIADFNHRQSENGKPDRADKIMTIRTQQAGEGLLAGTGRQPGNISGVVLNVNPSGDDYFANVVSQEIGHNFNLGHAQNVLIPAASVFDLLNKKSLPAAMNIMFNPINTSSNEPRMFSAQDWSTVRQGLLQLSSTGPT